MSEQLRPDLAEQSAELDRLNGERFDFEAIDQITEKCLTAPEGKGRLKPLFGNDIYLESSELEQLEKFLREAELRIEMLKNDEQHWGEFRDKLENLGKVVTIGLESFVLDIDAPELAELREMANPGSWKNILGLKLNKRSNGSYEKGETRYLLGPLSAIKIFRAEKALASLRSTVDSYINTPGSLNGTSAGVFAETIKKLKLIYEKGEDDMNSSD